MPNLQIASPLRADFDLGPWTLDLEPFIRSLLDLSMERLYAL